MPTKFDCIYATYFDFIKPIWLEEIKVYVSGIGDGIKLSNESVRAKLGFSRLFPNVVGLFLVAFGLVILVWVGWLTWYDMTFWGKDIVLIFFGSRTGEAISLGIGMKVIYYFLIGLALLLTGAVTFLRKQSKCSHHFGYLASLPKNVPIPQECLICLKVADCMMTVTRRSS